MKLNNFESEIEPKIVERGREYYRAGDVKKLEKVSADEFSATVFGTEKYAVYVKTNGDAIIEHVCDCPYDYGDVCKHEVAVFYAIRNGKFDDVSGKLNALLENTGESALRRFAADLFKKDSGFRREFLREFDENYEEDEEDFYDEDYY